MRGIQNLLHTRPHLHLHGHFGSTVQDWSVYGAFEMCLSVFSAWAIGMESRHPQVNLVPPPQDEPGSLSGSFGVMFVRGPCLPWVTLVLPVHAVCLPSQPCSLLSPFMQLIPSLTCSSLILLLSCPLHVHTWVCTTAHTGRRIPIPQRAEGRGGSGRMCPQEVPTQRDRPLEGQLFVQPETESESCWVVSDSLRPHGLYSPWNSPGQKTAVGSLPFSRDLPNPGIKPRYQLSHKGSPRILEWVAIPFSRGSSWPRNWSRVSCIAGRCFTIWAMHSLRTA